MDDRLEDRGGAVGRRNMERLAHLQAHLKPTTTDHAASEQSSDPPAARATGALTSPAPAAGLLSWLSNLFGGSDDDSTDTHSEVIDPL